LKLKNEGLKKTNMLQFQLWKQGLLISWKRKKKNKSY